MQIAIGARSGERFWSCFITGCDRPPCDSRSYCFIDRSIDSTIRRPPTWIKQ